MHWPVLLHLYNDSWSLPEVWPNFVLRSLAATVRWVRQKMELPVSLIFLPAEILEREGGGRGEGRGRGRVRVLVRGAHL